MGRCKFVPPEVVRIQLVSVRRDHLKELETKGVEIKEGKWRKATAAELSAARSYVEQGEQDGDWIDVKKELNAGETRAIFTDLVTNFQAGVPATLDPRQVGMTKAIQYIVGWSLVDAQGQGVPFSASALSNLYPDDYQEIITAVETHDETVDRLRTERKNAPASVTVSAQTS